MYVECYGRIHFEVNVAHSLVRDGEAFPWD
jgi:hypothetical protein